MDEQEPQRLDGSRIDTVFTDTPSFSARLRLASSRSRSGFSAQKIANPPVDMRRVAGDAKPALAVVRGLDPDRPALTLAMHDPVRLAAQRNDAAVLERFCRRQVMQPRRDPAAVLLGEFPGFLQAAARRHRENDLAGRRLNAQRIAARLPVPANPHQIDVLVVDDLDRLRFGRSPVQERAERHVTLDCFGLRYCHRPVSKHPLRQKIKQTPAEV